MLANLTNLLANSLNLLANSEWRHSKNRQELSTKERRQSSGRAERSSLWLLVAVVAKKVCVFFVVSKKRINFAGEQTYVSCFSLVIN